MTRSVLVVLSEPAEGAEDEYNRWYTNEHLPEVLEIPGFVAAQRYRVAEGAQIEDYPAPQKRYLALYEIEGDPAVAIKALVEQLRDGDIILPPVIDASSILPWCYSPVSERVTTTS